MRGVIALALLLVIAWGISASLGDIPFGTPKTGVGGRYIEGGREETGASNIVTSVVVNYRGFDTLGEVTILFVAAVGLGAVLSARRKTEQHAIEPASLVLYT
ncbi:MAG TPA: cation:proton antiporter, partial [Candidatus Eisenbacteria bacterium]|nr:cation:proton antiporter [Candidatus Eisenbacteria bacterium]